MKMTKLICFTSSIVVALCLALPNFAFGSQASESPKAAAQTAKSEGGGPQFRSGFFDRETFAPWFNLKDNLKENYNLDIGFDYTVTGAVSDSDYGEGEAVGHDLRFFGTWTPINPHGPNSGSLNVMVENRLGYTDLPPQDLGFDNGAVTLNALQFSDVGWMLSNLYWRQDFADDRFSIKLGQLNLVEYMDVYILADPIWGFQNISPVIPAFNPGLGAAGTAWFSDNVYGIAGIIDVNRDPSTPDLKVFDEGEVFQHVELGYTSSKDRFYMDNIHAILWRQNERKAQGIPEDWGVSLSASWLFDYTWAPFLRAAWSDKGTGLYEVSIRAGFGYFTPQQDVFAIGVNWGRPSNIPNVDAQWTFEAFYKYQVSEILAISPNIQYIVNPAFNANDDIIGIYGIRVRMLF